MTGRQPRRLISTEEALVVRAALERAPLRPDLAHLLATIDTLVVVDRCKCGCATVDFESKLASGEGTLLADGLGRTPSGAQVGIIVWGTERAISSLEIYDLDPGSSHALPLHESITSWEEAGRRTLSDPGPSEPPGRC